MWLVAQPPYWRVQVWNSHAHHSFNLLFLSVCRLGVVKRTVSGATHRNPALPLASSEASDKALKLSVPLFPYI